MQQRAHHAERQEGEGPEPQRQENRQESAVAVAHVAMVRVHVGVDVRVDVAVRVHVQVRVGVRISVAGEEQLHGDGANTDNQRSEVEDPHERILGQTSGLAMKCVSCRPAVDGGIDGAC